MTCVVARVGRIFCARKQAFYGRTKLDFILPVVRRRTGEEGEPDRERRQDEDKEEAWIFFYMRSAREEGNVDNAVRDDGGGISMVHRCGLKNLLMVKSESFRNLKATNYKKEPDQGQTNSYHTMLPKNTMT